jgi:hypothetical protein
MFANSITYQREKTAFLSQQNEILFDEKQHIQSRLVQFSIQSHFSVGDVMFDKCYLHIGLEKTGTTSIQKFLHVNRDELEHKGFFHPTALEAPNNTALFVYAAEEDRINDAHRIVRGGRDAEAYRSYLRDKLSAELSGKGGVLVLSNEHLHSEVRTEIAVQRVFELLAPFCKKIEVLAYLRRQDRVSVSQYSTGMKSGLQELPDVFKEVDEQLEYYFSYDKVLSNYSKVFGEENVSVRIFERESLEGGDAVLDFCQAIGLNEFSWLQRSRQSNESLRPIALRFLAEMNRHIPLVINGTANPLRMNIIRAIEQHYAGSGPAASRDKAIWFYDQFRESNERVRQKYFPDRERLFSDDFSMYQEVGVAPELTFEDAARMASILLQNTNG